MDNQEVIRLLDEDIRGEHGAIILYLRIAYALGEGEMTADIEEIARDEMRHYKWLAEEVVRLGGTPTTEREAIGVNTANPLELMQFTILREQDAVQKYQAHREAIADARIRALLERIAVDERDHHARFQHMIQQLDAGAVQPAAPPAPPPAVAADPLQQSVQGEYTTILQYLQQMFLTPRCPLIDDLEDQAIVEMTHLRWLAEYVAEMGTQPRLEHGSVANEGDPAQLLQSNIQLETDMEAAYQRQLTSAEDPKLRRIIERILGHSEYHKTLSQNWLSDLQTGQGEGDAAPPAGDAVPRPQPRRPASGWTVGSLLGKKQSEDGEE